MIAVPFFAWAGSGKIYFLPQQQQQTPKYAQQQKWTKYAEKQKCKKFKTEAQCLQLKDIVRNILIYLSDKKGFLHDT